MENNHETDDTLANTSLSDTSMNNDNSIEGDVPGFLIDNNSADSPKEHGDVVSGNYEYVNPLNVDGNSSSPSQLAGSNANSANLANRAEDILNGTLSNGSAEFSNSYVAAPLQPVEPIADVSLGNRDEQSLLGGQSNGEETTVIAPRANVSSTGDEFDSADNVPLSVATYQAPSFETQLMTPLSETNENSEFSDSDSEISGGMAVSEKPRRSRAKIISIIAVLTVLALLAGSMIGYSVYFSKRVLPNVYFNGQNLSNVSAEDVSNIVDNVAQDTSINVAYHGKTLNVKPSEMRYAIDVSETADNIVNAKRDNFFSQYNFFNHVNVPLEMSGNLDVAINYLNSKFIHEDQRMQPTNIAYNKNNNGFTIVKGKDGITVAVQQVEQALETMRQHPTEHSTVTLSTEKMKNPFSDAVAERVRDEASQYLSLSYDVTVKDKKDLSAKITGVDLALGGAISAKPNFADKTLAVSINKAKAKSVIDTIVKQKIDKQAHNAEAWVRPASEGGTKIGAMKEVGQEGIAVENLKDIEQEILNAFVKKTNASVEAVVKTTPFETKDVEVPHNFDTPNGDPWVDVDLTNQVATAYRGTTFVRKFNVATGLSTPDGSRLTPTGTYYVYLKYKSQRMRGPTWDQPNTPWISYFNGGVALHGVPLWMYGPRPKYIDEGRPGSHGCVNFPAADAKWMYDFAPIGTKVVVHGTTPTGAVRPDPSDNANKDNNDNNANDTNNDHD